MILRPFQKKAIQALAYPNHVVCVAPTGSGKSLIFEQLAQKQNTRMLLVSPLVALARQQVSNLRELGVRAQLGAGPRAEDPPQGHGVWVVSPEKLFAPFKKTPFEKLQKWKPNILVVDECHCLWDWGDSFRPAFFGVPRLIEELNLPKSLWLTATLPAQARTQLLALLPKNTVQIGAFALPNQLTLKAFRVPSIDRLDWLCSWIGSRQDPGLVFTLTRKLAERVHQALRQQYSGVAVYHAGFSREERILVEKLMKNQSIRIVVATNAFGMGINYKQLRWAVLWSTPPSLLSLAQVIGRVGRSTDESQAILFWDDHDFRMMEWTVRSSKKNLQALQDTYTFLKKPGCRNKNLAQYFGTEAQPCGKCDYCSTVGGASGD